MTNVKWTWLRDSDIKLLPLNQISLIEIRHPVCKSRFYPFMLTLRYRRHHMETFAALLALCEGNPPVPGGFPSQRPVARNFDAFIDLRLNKRLCKKLRGRCSLWRHCNDCFMNEINIHICIHFRPSTPQACLKHWPSCNHITEQSRYLAVVFLDEVSKYPIACRDRGMGHTLLDQKLTEVISLFATDYINGLIQDCLQCVSHVVTAVLR